MNSTPDMRAEWLALDTQLITELKALGLLTSQSQFSRLCGKNTSYFACMRHKRYGIQIGSLAFLATMLHKQMQDSVDITERAKLGLAAKLVNSTITQKCQLRALALKVPAAACK